MAVPTQDEAHVAEGLKKLTEAFKSKQNVKAILTELLNPFQELEDVFWSIINNRILDNNPTGDQLDIIGGLVGEARNGRADNVYLTAIRLRIKVNKSQGRAEDIIQIANIATPSTYDEYLSLKWLVTTMNTTADVTTLCKLLGAAKMGGSRGVLHFTTWDPSQNFVFSSVHGGVSVAGGFSDSHGNAVTQLLFCSARECKR